MATMNGYQSRALGFLWVHVSDGAGGGGLKLVSPPDIAILAPKEIGSGLMGEIHGLVSVSFRHGLAFVRGNLHVPYGFGWTGTVSGVAPPNPVPLHSEI